MNPCWKGAGSPAKCFQGEFAESDTMREKCEGRKSRKQTEDTYAGEFVMNDQADILAISHLISLERH